MSWLIHLDSAQRTLNPHDNPELDHTDQAVLFSTSFRNIQMKFVIKLFGVFLQAFQFTVRHAPVSLIAVVGMYFGFAQFANPASETAGITNYGFGIVMALASVSFGYARSLDESDAKEQIRYCGERFLHSSLLFLVASVVKYFLQQGLVRSAADGSGIGGLTIGVISVFPGFLFLGSLVNSIAALRELNAFLYLRKRPGQELGKFI